MIAGRWIVVSGSPVKALLLDEETKTDREVFSQKRPTSRLPTFDWTDEPPPAKLTPHVVWARSIDWANTPLGPMSSWSPCLRSNASLIMQDVRPAVGFYGPELIMVYNEAYVEILGGLHPCMGRSARSVLADIWHNFEPIIEQNLAGETVAISQMEVSLTRNGYLEETYFSIQCVPVFDYHGATIGHYAPTFEIVSYEPHSSSPIKIGDIHDIVADKHRKH